MAIVFELWAECRTPEDKQRFAEHVASFSHVLRSGRTVAWSTGDVHFEKQLAKMDPCVYEGYPAGLSNWGVQTLQDAFDATEAALQTYHHLLTAPPFRYVRIEWEAWTAPMCDLSEYHLKPRGADRRWLDLTCVLDEDLWVKLGRPEGVVEFRPGYVWKPYRGEIYQPFNSNDHPEFRELAKQLFPNAYGRKRSP